MDNSLQSINFFSVEVLNQTTENQSQVKMIDIRTDTEAISAWLGEYRNQKNTFDAYYKAAERFVLYIISRGIGLKQVNRKIALDFQDFLSNPLPKERWCNPNARLAKDDPAWRPFVKGLSVSSIKYTIQIIKSMYQFLIEAGYMEKNPFALSKFKVSQPKGEEKYFTEEQVEYLFRYIYKEPVIINPKQRKRIMYEYERCIWVFNLLFLTGLRRSEVAKAKMSDFELKSGNWWLKVVGKGDKEAKIPVTTELFAALGRFRVYLGLSASPRPDETLIPLIPAVSMSAKDFLVMDGLKPVNDETLYNIVKNTFKQIYEEEKHDNIQVAKNFLMATPHWMRHTSASMQAKAGMQIQIIKENLRHTNIATTTRYIHVQEDQRFNETEDKLKIPK